MKLVYETDLSLKECLVLLHDTQDAYDSYAVRKHGNEFRVWRDWRWTDTFRKNRFELPVMNGVLIPKDNRTQIELSFGKSMNWLIPIGWFIASMTACCSILLVGIAPGLNLDPASTILGGCILVPIFLALAVYSLRNVSQDLDKEQKGLIDLVTHKLHANPIASDSFGNHKSSPTNPTSKIPNQPS